MQETSSHQNPIAEPGADDFAAFVAALPEDMQGCNEWSLRHIWEIAQNNARIANHLETRAQDLGAITTLLEFMGLTVADLVAFERQQSGLSPFAPTEPDYMVPAGYRRAELNSGADPGEED